MATAKQLANQRRFARLARARARAARKGKRKSSRSKGRKALRSYKSKKVKSMSRRNKSRTSRSRRFKIPVVGILLGLGMADAASGGAVQQAATGNLSGAGAALRSAVASPGAAARKALPFAGGLAVYALVKRYVKPGANLGPVRIEV